LMDFDDVRNAIVDDNNFGDHSVCGDDLTTAAVLAVLLFLQASPEEQVRLRGLAEARRATLRERYPALGLH